MTNVRNRYQQVSKVNTPPRGLQSLAGNVNQGINPHELSHLVRPTVDLVPFWGVDKLTVSAAFTSIKSFGQGAELVVPDGELWLMISASCDYFLAGGDECRLNLHMTDPAGTARPIIAVSQTRTATGVEQLSVGASFAQPLILSPGWRLRGQLEVAVIADLHTLTVDAAYYKISG